MSNIRRSILLPVNTVFISEEKEMLLTHLQILKNDRIKSYEIRLFNAELQISKSVFQNMTINVMSEDDNTLSLIIAEQGNSNKLEIQFKSVKDVLRVKKYVDTLLV